jgi:hypothetical protein
MTYNANIVLGPHSFECGEYLGIATEIFFLLVSQSSHFTPWTDSLSQSH